MAQPTNVHAVITVKGSVSGSIKIRLFADQAPVTTENFIAHARKGTYDDSSWHRVIPNFMIQGGDPVTKGGNRAGAGTGGCAAGFHKGYGNQDDPSSWCIPDEFIQGASHRRGTVSMANAGPNTGGSQFFICVAAAKWLDGKHAIFGEVVSGMDIVDRIVKLPADRSDNPNVACRIEKVEIVQG